MDLDKFAQLLQAAKGEPRPNLDDPFSKRNMSFKELGGWIFDGSYGIKGASEWWLSVSVCLIF